MIPAATQEYLTHMYRRTHTRFTRQTAEILGLTMTDTVETATWSNVGSHNSIGADLDEGLLTKVPTHKQILVHQKDALIGFGLTQSAHHSRAIQHSNTDKHQNAATLFFLHNFTSRHLCMMDRTLTHLHTLHPRSSHTPNAQNRLSNLTSLQTRRCTISLSNTT